MYENPKFYVLRAGEGKPAHVMGHKQTFLQSDDHVSVFVNEFEAGVGVPMHIHPEMDEACYVLQGELKFVAGDETVMAKAGDYVSCARGLAHGFVGVGQGAVRLLWVCTPGGYDEFFDAVALMPIGPEGPDMGAMIALAEAYGTQIVGPPPE